MSWVTTESVKEHFMRVAHVLKNEECTSSVEARNNRIRDDEQTLISKLSICPLSQAQRYHNRLGSLNPSVLKDFLTQEFYNHELMNDASCVISSIYYGLPASKDQLISPNVHIRHWIKNLQINEQLSDDKIIEAHASLTNIPNDPFFTVKTARDPKYRSLTHEYFVGVFGTNQLRKYVPNFAYVFGGFNCSPPVNNPTDDQIITWCNNSHVNVNYVLYENLKPHTTMAQYVRTCSPRDFFNKYLQVLYALHEANEKIGFTHYDLHHKNVVIRKLDTLSDIPYNTENGLEYIRTDGVATITNYDHAHIAIQINGEESKCHFGIVDKLAYGVYPGKSYPLFDAYKLLLFCMDEMNNANNKECLIEAGRILRYFNSIEYPIDIIERQREYYYYLPYDEVHCKDSLLKLTSYIRNLKCFPQSYFDFITNDAINPILSCNSTNVCTSGDQFINLIGLSSSPSPRTIYELYDVLTTVDSQTGARITQEFDYKSRMSEFLTEYRSMGSELETKLSNLKIYTISDSKPQNIFNDEFTQLYQTHVVNVAAILNLVQQLANNV